MKLSDGLQGVSRLGFDTAPLIYLIEARPPLDAIVLEIVRRVEAGEITGITSVMTLGEVMVQPLAHGDVELGRRYREVLLKSAGFQTCPIDADAAESAAQLHARHGLRLPDALQIAVAQREGCGAFLTNDRRLTRVTELRILLLEDLELE